jgi:endonuclease/exonuclease/phosphatase (EEP) superfamily protein YafD
MVLGNDGLCYNRRDIRKSDREHVPGRKPLLTGGDLNAITRAARAARRVKVQQKKLEKLGLLQKPRARGGYRRSPGVITKSEAAKALRS